MDNRSNNDNHNNEKEKPLEQMLETYYSDKLKKKLSKKLESDYGVVRDKLPVPRRRVLRIVSSIAATLAVLVMFNVFFNPFGPNATELAENMIQETPLLLPEDFNVRGENNIFNLENDIQDALSQEDYARAKDLFIRKEQTTPLSLLDKFYYGISLLKLSEENSQYTIGYLNEVANTQNPFQMDAKWYLALAYVQNEEFEKAKSILTEMVENSNYQKSNAKKLLKKLNT